MHCWAVGSVTLDSPGLSTSSFSLWQFSPSGGNSLEEHNFLNKLFLCGRRINDDGGAFDSFEQCEDKDRVGW